MFKASFPVFSILADPGAVSRAGRKGATKVFKHRRKSPWVPTLTGPFPNGQVNAGSWLGTKNALYYCAQSANSFSWVLFVSSYTMAIISPQLPGSFTKLVRTRETFIFYFPNQKRRNYRCVEKRFGCYQQEQFILHWENSVSDGSQCIVNNRKFKMRRRRDSKKAIAWQGKTTTLLVHHAFCRFLCRHCTTTTWKCLISGFVKDVNKQWQNFLSLYELGYGWFKISSRRVCLHLTK